MTPTALKALKGSIAKWKSIAAGIGQELGDSNCPLCKKYLHRDCEGCPVREATGETNCDGTPYRTAWERAGYPKMAETAAEKAAATEMLDFLKSLLPTKTKKRTGAA